MPNHDFPTLRYPLSWRSWRFRLVVAMLIVVLTVRLVWGWQVERMLKQQLDAARSRGEAAAVEDVKFATVLDAENAWTLQGKAVQAHVARADSPRNSNDDYKDYLPFPNFWIRRARASENAHAKVFALARQARSLPRAQMRNRLEAPLINNFDFPGLNNARQLASTLTDGALYVHVLGDDAEALERIMDAMHLAQSLRQDPFVVSQLVAIGIDAMANQTLQIVAPGLHINNSAMRHPVTAAQIRTLIAQLLDENMSWQGFESSLPMERLVTADFLNVSAQGTWMIRPLAQMESVRTNRYFEFAIKAGQLRNSPAAKAVLAGARVEEPMNNPLTVIMGSNPIPKMPRYSRWFLGWSGDLSRNFEIQFRCIAERRMTAVSLAAQLYRADHAGWPVRLSDLAPDYLPALPSDPFYDDGRALGYIVLKGARPDGGDRPMVSVGAGPDQTGAIRREPMYGYQYYGLNSARQSLRQYRDLSRFVPASPSTQAVNNNPNKPNTPGKQPKEDDPAQHPEKE